MLLWLSGVPHASVPGPLPEGQQERGMRMSTFVSMLPIELLDAADIAKRREMLEAGNTSGHRVTAKGKTKAKPYVACDFPKTGRTYGKELPDFRMDHVVTGFKRRIDKGDVHSTAAKTARLCGGY